MCPDDSEFIRLLAEELPPERREAALAHLASCPACRELFDALRAASDALGRWELNPPARDFVESVMQAAAGESSQRFRWARIAAAIVLAGGVGLAAGLVAPVPQQAMTQPQGVTEEQVVQSLGLDLIAQQPSALAHVYLQAVDQAPAEEEPS